MVRGEEASSQTFEESWMRMAGAPHSRLVSGCSVANKSPIRQNYPIKPIQPILEPFPDASRLSTISFNIHFNNHSNRVSSFSNLPLHTQTSSRLIGSNIVQGYR